jgi:hypothetical protein
LQQEYPPIARWLAAFEVPAKKRQDQGEYWWELRACAYYDAFEQPKIVYVDMADKPGFCLETSGAVVANTGYFVPSDDSFLQALLVSKPMWFVIKGMTTILRGGFFRLFTQHLEKLPIPTATPTQRAALAALAQQAQAAAAQRRDVIKTFGHQVLRDLAPGKATAKLPSALHNGIPEFTEFAQLIKDKFKLELRFRQRNEWEAALNEARSTVIACTHAITQCEQDIDKLVYQLFDLTAAEVKLIEG